MMKTPHRPDPIKLPASIHTATRAVQAWVLAAAAVFVGLFERHLPRALRIEMRGCVREAAHYVRVLVIVQALAQWKRPVRRAVSSRPRSTPPGFRRGRHNGSVKRRLKRVVRVGAGSIAQRIARLRHILANPEAFRARLLARLDMQPRARFSAVRPPAQMVRAVSQPSCVATDTS